LKARVCSQFGITVRLGSKEVKMNTMARASLGIAIVLGAASSVFASGQVGIYAVVEKVVFEPNEQAPERIQVWGAFAFHDPRTNSFSAARRGYMYFRLPGGSRQEQDNVKNEWKDLKAVAGTGQAVAFGQWGYIGGLEGLAAEGRTARSGPPYALSREGGTNSETDVRVRSESEAPTGAAAYTTNVGVVKLSADGSNSEIVRKLKDAVKK
jgi:hypothetical protein